jgi:TonB-dependent starch-binding outer membrane protein SusC
MKNFLFLGVFPKKKHLQKTLLIMKLTTFFLILATLQSFADGYGQSSIIKLNNESQTLLSVIEAIENQSDYKIFYKTDQVDVTQIVNIDLNEATVASVLNKALDGTHLSYVVMDKLIVFARAENMLQSGKVTGTITDATTNEPLIGVNISVEGTTKGVISDINGQYTIDVQDEKASLVFSYIGYGTVKVPVSGKSTINITLVQNITNLQEVVVVGYGQQKKSDLTGSISSVKGNELTQLPAIRADQALQGRAAGVVVTNNDGAPGGMSTTIRIRGGNSITGGNNALVVIDGFQGGNLSSLNPNEIASVEVLKDASATAIYGSRGANGVILVTTKSGKKGAPVIDYSYSSGVQSIGHKINLMSAGDYARIQNAYKATQNLNTPTPLLPFTQAQIDALDQTGGTDWQNELFRKANLQMHQLSIKGGTDMVKYFISGGYLDQQGIIINTNFKRYTLRSNIDVDLNKRLKAGFYVNVIKDKGNLPPSGEGTRFVDILAQSVNSVLRFDPITPVYDELGNYSKAPTAYGDKDIWNPVATAMGSFNETNDITSNLNSFLEFKIMEGLTFRVTGAIGIENSDAKAYYNHLTKNGSTNDGFGSLTDDKSIYYQNSNILTYDRTLNSKHHITLTGVAEQQAVLSYGSYLEAQGFSSDFTGVNDIGGASQINTKSSYDNRRAINSLLGRINYGYDNRYLLTISYRADGASVFGANNKWGYFPSASLAWRASEESFIKDLNVFSDLKFRGSWGKTGNQAINPYGSLDAIGSGFNYPYYGTGSTDIGYAITRAANPNLKWESTAQTDLGVDISLFKGRLTATADVYKKITDNLLLNRPVPFYTGFTLLLDNVGSIENKGLEITVGGDPIDRDFKWNTSVNISANRGKVLKLVDALPLGLKTSTGGGYGIYYQLTSSLMYLQEGQPMGQMRGYINEGTWKENEREQAALYGQLPGDTRYKDINGDTLIDQTNDVTVIGNSSPKFVFGWTNSMSYKNFTLTFLIQGSQGNDIFNATRIKLESPTTGSSPALNDRWTIDNQNTVIPAFTDERTREDAQLGESKVLLGRASNRSSRWVEDGSYIRLRTITLGYDLPKSLISKVGLASLRAYVTAANILTLTRYTGYDPEVSSFNIGTDGGRGIDMSNYPTVKTITLGINLTF